MTRPWTPSFRVDWVPGSDVLHGRCWCGEQWDAPGPAELLAWLEAHHAR